MKWRIRDTINAKMEMENGRRSNTQKLTIYLLCGPVKNGATINEFPVIFRHCFGSGLRGEDSVVAVSFQFGQKEIVKLICFYFLKKK